MTDQVRYAPPGDCGTRRDRWVLLVTFWVAMALVCVAAVVIVLVRETSTTDAACPPNRICTGPPAPLPASGLATWTSPGRGVALQYPASLFSVETKTNDTLRLRVRASRPSGVEASLWITAQPGTDGLPQDALRQRRANLTGSILGLTEDQDPRTIIPPPRIGTFPGVGGSYRGTADTPQGPAKPAIAVIAAAGNGRTNTVMSYVITGTDDAAQIRILRGYVSPILTSFTWAR